MAEVLAVTIAVALAAIFVGLEQVLRPDASAVSQRLVRYGSRRALVDQDDIVHGSGGSALALFVTRGVERAIAGRSFAASLQMDLARANLKLTASEFLVLQGSSTVAVAAVVMVLSQQLVVSVAFGLLGFVLPKLWVARRQSARLKAFNDQLADTIQLISNSLRSGLSLLQAMDLVSKEGAPPISEEFARVVREVGLGISPQEALQHLVERVKSDDLELMVTAILVQYELGGNLSRILDTISNTIRERVKLKGEIRTLTAQQRLAGYMLAGLPVFLAGVLSLLQPRYLAQLFEPGPWILLPIAATVMVVFGFFVIGRIVNIEV